MDDIAAMLRGVEFFHDIAEEHLQRVASISKIVEFPGRHEIFREDEPAREVYIVISGRVLLVICSPYGRRQLVEVGEGELIGWSPLVGRQRLSDTAYTLIPTKTVEMNGERILDLCTEDPRFGFEFMRRATQTLASRLSATRIQLLKMSGALLPQAPIESD